MIIPNDSSYSSVEFGKACVDNSPNTRELETIQTKEKLNRVFSLDEEGPGGAHHEYIIFPADDNFVDTITADEETNMSTVSSCLPIFINFQCGPRKEESSFAGALDVDLLEIVRDRMKSFQAGPFACDYNAEALEHIEAALKALNRRVEDRIARNVLGKNEK